jgi:hypothetical protein
VRVAEANDRVDAARAALEHYLGFSAEVGDREKFLFGLADREAALDAARLAVADASAGLRVMPDLDAPTPDDMRTIFEVAIDDLAVRRGREPLPERVMITLAC